MPLQRSDHPTECRKVGRHLSHACVLRKRARLLPMLLLLALLLQALAACRQPSAHRPSAHRPSADAALDSAAHFESAVLDELPPFAGYRIGLQTEVTGQGAAIGDLTIRAARLAVEEINAAGGINGMPLELIVRDVASNPELAVSAYRAALAEDDLVALIGPFKSAYAINIVPEHITATLPMFIGATNVTLTGQGDPDLFRMRPSDGVTAAAMVAFATDALGARRLAVIHDTDAFGRGGAQQVTQQLAGRGLTPTVQIGYVTGATDLDAVAAELAESAVDGVLIYGTNGTDVGRLLRSIRYWDVAVPIITSPGGATVPAHNIAAEAQDGIYLATDAVLGATAEGRRFLANFRERFGLEPDTYITWTYDAIHLLAAQLAAEPDATGRELSDLIRAADFQGAQGAYRFDEAGDGLHEVTLVRMENGQAQPLGYFADGELTLHAPEQSAAAAPADFQADSAGPEAQP